MDKFIQRTGDVEIIRRPDYGQDTYLRNLRTFCVGVTGINYDTLSDQGKESCAMVYLGMKQLFPNIELRDLIYEAGLKVAVRNYQTNEEEIYLK